MLRIWAKVFQDNRLIKDTVILNSADLTRTNKVFQALDQICYEFDLGKPILLDVTINDFNKHSNARFTKDNFIEEIDFDFLAIEVIAEV